MTRQEAIEFIKAFVKLRSLAADEVSLQVPNLYPTWRENATYALNDRVLYNDTLYKVLQAHNAQPDWTPDIAVSLFAKVLIPDENVISEWVQPDSTNPYMTGDKVSHNGQTWASTINNNVWEPGVYGWETVE